MEKMMEEIVSTLIRYQTVQENTQAMEECLTYIRKLFSWYPFVVRKYNKDGVLSLVLSTEETISSDIILNAHIDVVPGDQSLFTLREKSGIWYGRGVSDMKFAIAVFVSALKILYTQEKRLPSLSLMITSDEEPGGKKGVGYLVNEVGYKGKVIICPDGGDNLQIVEEAKGVLHLKVATTGASSHGSRPWEGVSANDLLLDKLQRLRTYFPESKRETWDITLTIGVIRGGVQTNQVANAALAKLDFRYPASVDPEGIIRRVSMIFGKDNIESLSTGDVYTCDRNDARVKLWEQELRKIHPKGKIYSREYGASDARYFSSKGMTTIVCKPIGGSIHTDKEWIDKQSVTHYRDLLVRYMKKFL